MDGESPGETEAGRSIEDIESYVLSSKYRSNVLEHLAAEARATPKEIATAKDDPRPHVSRALSELRGSEVVELLVPETRTVGRYYGLTDTGKHAWENIKGELQSVQWSIREPTDPRIRAAVELASDEFGEAFRSLGTYDGEEFTVWYARPDVRSNYSEETFEQVLRTLIFDHPLEDLEMLNSDCRSETIHFGECLMCRVRIGSGLRVLVSFDETRNVSVPAFSERIRSEFESG